LDQI
jgi:hypothetical protein